MALLQDLYEQLAPKPAPLVRSGLRSLDRHQPLLPGHLWLVMSPPRQGRTMFALMMAANAAMARVPTRFIAGLDERDEILTRLIAQTGRVPLHRVRERDPDDATEVADTIRMLQTLPFEYFTRSELRIERATALLAARALLVVDDLDLCTPDPLATAQVLKDWARTTGGGVIITMPNAGLGPGSPDWQAWMRCADLSIDLELGRGERQGSLDLRILHSRHQGVGELEVQTFYARAQIIDTPE